MDKRERVVVIIPTYNEKGNIVRLSEKLFDDVFASLGNQYDMHVLIVDDSSPDGTGKEVERLSKKYSRLHLFTNPKKLGLGNAYTKGMQHALGALNADIVFEFDADFQHDPSRIPVMLTKIEAGYDIVLGARYIPGGSIPDTWGFYRKFLSVVGNLVIRVVITDFSIHDWTTGYRAIRRRVVETILPEMNTDTFMGYTFQIGFLHKAVRYGYRVAEVPIHFIDRTFGKSKLGKEYIKNTLLYIFKVRFKEIINARVFKFALVGAVGAGVQLLMFTLLSSYPYALAVILSIEAAILSNFIWNNIWTFTDRRLPANLIPVKFIQFNAASLGSVGIQFVVALLGKSLIGLYDLMRIGPLTVTSGHIYLIIGIGIGMVWNYLTYSRFVWKQHE